MYDLNYTLSQTLEKLNQFFRTLEKFTEEEFEFFLKKLQTCC